MADNLILVFFACIFGGIIAYILGYQLIKHMKGSLYFDLTKRSYYYGETLNLILNFHAKKDIRNHLLELDLIAYRREHTQGQKGNAYRNVELFRQTQEIERQTNYIAGTKKDFEVKLLIPKIEDFEESFRELIHKKNSINKAFQTYYHPRYRRGKLRWKIRVSMHCDGIDLTATEGIRLAEREIQI